MDTHVSSYVSEIAMRVLSGENDVILKTYDSLDHLEEFSGELRSISVPVRSASGSVWTRIHADERREGIDYTVSRRLKLTGAVLALSLIELGLSSTFRCEPRTTKHRSGRTTTYHYVHRTGSHDLPAARAAIATIKRRIGIVEEPYSVRLTNVDLERLGERYDPLEVSVMQLYAPQHERSEFLAAKRNEIIESSRDPATAILMLEELVREEVFTRLRAF